MHWFMYRNLVLSYIIRKNTNETLQLKRSKSYLFQSLISIAVQRGNGAGVMGTTSSADILEDLAYL